MPHNKSLFSSTNLSLLHHSFLFPPKMGHIGMNFWYYFFSALYKSEALKNFVIEGLIEVLKSTEEAELKGAPKEIFPTNR